MFDIDLRRVYIQQDPAEGFILNYTLLIGDASFTNFQKVCVETQVQLYCVILTALLLCDPYRSIIRFIPSLLVR